MRFEIKNSFTGNTQFAAEIDCDESASVGVKIGLSAQRAFSAGVSLSGADLRGADLRGADLRGADLRGASYGENIPVTKPPLQLLGLSYDIFIFDTHIKIGCELHSADEWRNFDDRRIAEMDGKKALEWWRAYKPLVMSMADAHCVTEKADEAA